MKGATTNSIVMSANLYRALSTVGLLYLRLRLLRVMPMLVWGIYASRSDPQEGPASDNGLVVIYPRDSYRYEPEEAMNHHRLLTHPYPHHYFL